MAADPALGAELTACEDWAQWYSAVAASAVFREKLWWKRPVVLPAPPAAGFVTSAYLDDRIKLFEAASVPAKLNAAIKTPRGWSYVPLVQNGAVVEFERTQRALECGTLIYPEVHTLCPVIASAVLAAQSATGLPANANVYRTPPGRSESSPAHTDHHDVFVAQAQGSKRWRVWDPPPRVGGRDPLLRGKFPTDRISPADLGEPALDVVLQTGQVLYVPLGFPHFVQTDIGCADVDSVHVTTALGCHEHDLAYLSARRLTLGGPNAELDHDQLGDREWLQLAEALPVGFLSDRLPPPRGDCGAGDAVGRIAAELRARIAAAEPGRFDQAELAALPCGPVCELLLAWHRRLVAAHERLYLAAQAADSTPDETRARAAELKAAEDEMQQGEQELYDACRAARAAAPPPPPAAAGPGRPAGTRARGAFGGPPRGGLSGRGGLRGRGDGGGGRGYGVGRGRFRPRGRGGAEVLRE
eukprot:TRINITY_DN4200_c0_g1_i1.p3 TRINITY_DN4200_c0_g1~~TRINITY_DN4200_c0_g1_i1.p3  ORF type:complete len:471 (+),score=135.23 TRINITY_DN4200_c0_g1_i1:69-1481(+)